MYISIIVARYQVLVHITVQHRAHVTFQTSLELADDAKCGAEYIYVQSSPREGYVFFSVLCGAEKGLAHRGGGW